MPSNQCSICGKTIGFLDSKYKILNNEIICAGCMSKAGGTSQLTVIKNMDSVGIEKRITDIAEHERIRKDRFNKFKTTKKIGEYIYIDEEKSQWAVPTGVFSKSIQNSMIHEYSDIIDFELIEDGTSVSKGGLGRAVAGGLLFGGVGAVVGGVTGGKKATQLCTTLKIKITLNDIKNPIEYINFISAETKKSSFIYNSAFKNAQEVMSMLQIMCESVKVKKLQEEQNAKKQEIKTVETINVADEIKKFKDLLDMGAITQEEFDTKKKELLKL